MSKPSFNIYIDESGDEGFTIKDGVWVSSRWFVLGALITRSDTDLPLSKCVDTIKSAFNWADNKPLHFTKFSHEKKKFVIDCMTKQKGFMTCYIAVDKKRITDQSLLKQTKRYLYNYFTRYLLERVSWLVTQQKGEAHLIFENRANTSYAELNKYITDLIGKSQIKPDIFVSWKAVNKGQLKNIQLADAITSSLYNALEPNKFGLIEESYINTLKPTIYHRQNNYHAYGLKIFPRMCNDKSLILEYPWMQGFTKG